MKVFLLVISLIFCQELYSATYYISPAGNDTTGDGSLSLPWASLHKATTEVITAGDTIQVLAGVYYETEECFLAAGVSIQGAGLGACFIYSQYSAYFSTFLTLNSPDGTNGNQFISGLNIDGGYVNDTLYKTWVAIWVTGRSNVNIHHCLIRNFKNRGVIFDGNHAVEPRQDTGLYATGNRFEFNAILNSAENNGSYGAGLLNLGAQAGMIISNNNLVQNQRDSFANGWPVKYWDNGWLRGLIFHNNTLIKSPFLGSYPGEGGDWDFAVELFNIQGLEFYNNYLEGSIDLNYNYKGSYNYSAWIHNNIFDHPVLNGRAESGVIFEYRTESALVEKNIMNNISTGVIFNTRAYNDPGGNDSLPVPPTGGYSYLTDIVIRNNLFTNVYQSNGASGGAGVIFHSESANDSWLSNLQIDYNTIVARDGDEPWFGLLFTSFQNGMATNVNIRNNIVDGFLGSWMRGDSVVTNIQNMVVSNNNAWDNGFGNGNQPAWPGGNPTYYTYSNNLSVDPRFVSATNYHLQPGSALFSMATGITGVTTDLVYNKRNALPTIGAYEDKILFSAKLFLQGAYSTALGRHKDVSPGWAALLDTSASHHPYSAAPFNYTGADSVSAGFFTSTPATTDILDWVLLELRDAANPASVITSRAAFVREDGMVVDLDGISPVGFKGVNTGNYFIAIRHRNHLGIRTAAPQFLEGTLAAPPTYDFTLSQAQVYQNTAITSNAPMAQDGTVYMLWAGNANQDSYVRAITQTIPPPLKPSDAAAILVLLGGDPNATGGYTPGDVNMDGYTRATTQTIPPPIKPSDAAFILSTPLGGDSNATRREHL